MTDTLTGRLTASLAASDPEVARLVDAEGRRQSESIRLIAQRELRLAAVLEATGSCSRTSTPKGTPRKRYYEGQQVDRPDRGAGDRRGPRQLFGADHVNVQPYSGSPANLAVYLAFLQPGDTVHGARPAVGRAPDSRLERVGHRQVLQERAYGVRARTTTASTSTRCASSRAAQARSSSSAAARRIPRTLDFAGVRRDRRRGRAPSSPPTSRTSRASSPAGAHPSPVGIADVVTTTTHKTLPRPARRHDHVQRAEHAEAIDKAVFPGLQGGPHNHTTAAIAVARARPRTAGFKTTRTQIVANAKALADGAARARLRPHHRRHRQPPDAHRPDQQEHRRQARRPGARSRRHRRQLQRDPLRPAQALRPVRPPPRHAADHVAGPDRGAHAVRRPWMDEAITAAKSGDEGTLTRIRGEVADFVEPFQSRVGRADDAR